MDAKLISERHVIERYLAGQLDDAEAEAFEQALEAQPELARDVERIARMKTGFEVLQRRGELGPLLIPPVVSPKRRAVWMGAAAAVVLALGVVVFRPAGKPTPSPAMLLAVSLDKLSSRSESPIPLRASVALARARGMGADAELSASPGAPGAAELELSTGAAPGTHYGVELLAVDTAGARVVAKVPAAATDSAGAVHLFVALHSLPPGSYLLRLSPPDAGAPIEYSIAMRPTR